MNTVLYRTTAKCATQCTAKIFFAPIATSNTAYLFATRLVCPTNNQCRGEIFFARIATSNIAYLFASRPVSPNTTDTPYLRKDPTIVPNIAGHRRRAMCWGCVAAPTATPLSCQINLDHNWR